MGDVGEVVVVVRIDDVVGWEVVRGVRWRVVVGLERLVVGRVE